MPDDPAIENVILPRVEIKLDGYGGGSLLVDGVTIPGCHNFSLRHEEGQPPRLDLVIIAERVSVEARVILAPHVQRELSLRSQM